MIRSLGFEKTPSPSEGLRRDINILVLGGIAVLSAIVLRIEDTCGGVEGGVSSSSEDEDEEASKTRDGERGTGREIPGRVESGACCDEKIPCGRGGTRRGRGIAFLCLGAPDFDIDRLDTSAESWASGVERGRNILSDVSAHSRGVSPMMIAGVDGTRDVAPCEESAVPRMAEDGESEEGKESELLWRFGSGAILRLRFTGVGFGVGADPILVGRVSQEVPDASTMIGDKSGGRGSGFLDFRFRGKPLEDL